MLYQDAKSVSMINTASVRVKSSLLISWRLFNTLQALLYDCGYYLVAGVEKGYATPFLGNLTIRPFVQN